MRSHTNALHGEWDYTKYIGRQMNCLTVGVIGYGRLGSMYANYCRAFGARVMVFDPYKSVSDAGLEKTKEVDAVFSVIGCDCTARTRYG